MKTPEGYIKDGVKKYLKSINAFFFLPATFGFGASGTPDICCCIRGCFVAIEVKREGKVPTPLQRGRMTQIHRSGGIAIWGDSADMIIGKLQKELGLDC